MARKRQGIFGRPEILTQKPSPQAIAAIKAAGNAARQLAEIMDGLPEEIYHAKIPHKYPRLGSVRYDKPHFYRGDDESRGVFVYEKRFLHDRLVRLERKQNAPFTDFTMRTQPFNLDPQSIVSGEVRNFEQIAEEGFALESLIRTTGIVAHDVASKPSIYRPM